MPKEIYISYSRRAQEFVTRLASELDAQVAGEPHVKQRQGCVFAPAMMLSNPVSIQVAVSEWTACSQFCTDLLEQFRIGQHKVLDLFGM